MDGCGVVITRLFRPGWGPLLFAIELAVTKLSTGTFMRQRSEPSSGISQIDSRPIF
jgi:hypothetical protein